MGKATIIYLDTSVRDDYIRFAAFNGGLWYLASVIFNFFSLHKKWLCHL